MKHDIDKVLILGSAALKIGESGEFDYSGSQAIKAFKEEGIRTILINPNIATIQTSDYMADEIYLLPLNTYFVEKVIAKERPQGILVSFGGQTALNCAIDLFKKGILEKYNLQIMGTPIDTIINSEDRDLFVKKLKEIGVKTPRGKAVTTVKDAMMVAEELDYPVIIRAAFTLGGLGSGVCYNIEELEKLARKSFTFSTQILVEEFLEGWKEIEYEVMRDKYDNCITVCNMENFDPMGIHTGESIVVAPSQTLTNEEYHNLREVAIKVIRHLGVVGECNIQYSVRSDSLDYRVIEVNARMSRSSAMASKATGYPLAFVATKLALGYGLHELSNSITKVTTAFFEPALDYIVVKIPRWDLKKFRMVSRRLGSGMKSVGEVMAIGRKFEEALQKALRMLNIGARGLVVNDSFSFKDLIQEIKEPTEDRIFAIAEALKQGYSIDWIHNISHVDCWFLHKIAIVVDIERELRSIVPHSISDELLIKAKKAGFSDEQIALLTHREEEEIFNFRKENNIRPYVCQIDTMASEYPSQTNYLYLSYNRHGDDIGFEVEKSVIIIGSGAYCIGSSVEFDWCLVNSGITLRNLGFHTIMINYNPETVSTDYDEFDKLFFEEINVETIREIYEFFKPEGVIVSMGGQISNNLALKLHHVGLRILGTSPKMIDMAEDRNKFSSLLDSLKIDQPLWKELKDFKDIQSFANKVGYPVLVRPSYVLSGAAMAVASNDMELSRYLQLATDVSTDHPIVVSKFIENAKEIEMDAVARDGELMVYAITEHVENAGVHSGDAILVVPPQYTYMETIRRIQKITKQIASSLMINGPFNIQFIAVNNEVMVIECNLRASRSFPFVSKILKENFIDIATKVIVKEKVEKVESSFFELEYVGVKVPQFSFIRLEGADPTLGVEMASTGEVACMGDNFHEAFLKALISVGYKFPIKRVLLSSGPIGSKAGLLESAKLLQEQGVEFYATGGTAKFMNENGIKATMLHWPLDKQKPNTVDFIKEKVFDLIINIPKNYQEDELTNDYIIRRMAVDNNIPLITNHQIAKRLAETLSMISLSDLQIKSWSEY